MKHLLEEVKTGKRFNKSNSCVFVPVLIRIHVHISVNMESKISHRIPVGFQF